MHCLINSQMSSSTFVFDMGMVMCRYAHYAIISKHVISEKEKRMINVAQDCHSQCQLQLCLLIRFQIVSILQLDCIKHCTILQTLVYQVINRYLIKL